MGEKGLRAAFTGRRDCRAPDGRIRYPVGWPWNDAIDSVVQKTSSSESDEEDCSCDALRTFE